MGGVKSQTKGSALSSRSGLGQKQGVRCSCGAAGRCLWVFPTAWRWGRAAKVGTGQPLPHRPGEKYGSRLAGPNSVAGFQDTCAPRGARFHPGSAPCAPASPSPGSPVGYTPRAPRGRQTQAAWAPHWGPAQGHVPGEAWMLTPLPPACLPARGPGRSHRPC